MKSKWAMFALLVCLLAAMTACDCGDDDDDDAAGDDDSDDDDDGAGNDDDSGDDDLDDDDDAVETFRIAVVSDPNIVAGDLLHWNDKSQAVVAALNNEPDIDFVLILGDLGVRFYEWWWDEYNDEYDPSMTWEDCIEAAVAIWDELEMPYYLVPGDKDYANQYQINWGFGVDWANREERNQQLRSYLGEAFPGSEPWYSFERHGARFFAGNSLAGDLWQDGFGMTGSLGSTQLDALATEIADGTPTIFLSHHSGGAIMEPAGEQTLEDVLSAKAGNVIAVFNGHHFSYQEYEYAGVDGYSFDAVSDGDLYYAIAEVDPVAGTVTIVNHDDLPYPPDYVDYECEPGESHADMSGMVDTFHALFVVAMDTDYWLLDLLLSSAELGETPFAFWIHEDLGSDNYEIMLTLATMYPEGGDHAIAGPVSEYAPPCEMFTWQMDDPCMQTVDAEISYNVLQLINSSSPHAECGVEMTYETGFLFEVTVGDDADGNTSLKTGQITVTLEKSKVVETIKQFIVDSYCAYECDPFQGEIIFPAGQCNAETNGDAAACDAGTLTFDEVPAICDTMVGSTYMLPMRLVLSMIELLPEGMEVTLRFSGWGHQMVFSNPDDMDQDWAMQTDVWPWECPEQPPTP